MFYLIALTLMTIAVMLFVVAPRNLWDMWLFIIGVIMFVFAMLQSPVGSLGSQLAYLGSMILNLVMTLAPISVFFLGLAMFFYSRHHYLKHGLTTQFFWQMGAAVLLTLLSVVHYRLLRGWLGLEKWVHMTDFVLAYYVLVVVYFLLTSLRLSLLNDEEQKDYLIVLGGRIYFNGQPYPRLKDRLDKTLEYVEHQRYLYETMPKIIVSGGKTIEGLDKSEAESMGKYLINRGIPKEKIIYEDQAKNTFQNFVYSKKILEADPRPLETLRGAFITSNYHLLRSQNYAHDLKLYQFGGIGASTPFKDIIINGFRELVALFFYKRYWHLVMTIVLLLIGIFIFQ